MKYFPVVSPVSHVTSQRGVQPGNKVAPTYPVCCTLFITQRFDAASVLATLCASVVDARGGVFYFKVSGYI